MKEESENRNFWQKITEREFYILLGIISCSYIIGILATIIQFKLNGWLK